MISIALDSQILTALMTCPRMCHLRFDRRLQPKGGKSNSLECGSLVHTILEFYAKEMINSADRVKAIESGFLAGKEYIKHYNELNKFILDKEHEGMLNTPEQSDSQFTGWSFVLETMREYFDFWRNDSWTIIGAEEVRKKIIYEDSDIRILWKAKFDRIVDTEFGFVSMDHKTMKQRRDTLAKNNQFMGHCFLLESRNVIIDKIGFQKSLKASEKFLRVPIPYSTDSIEEWSKAIVPHYARMLAAYNEADNYPPNFNACEGKYGKCNYYEEICNADRNIREEAMKLFFNVGKVWDISSD